MSERPLNAETPIELLRSWVTADSIFFDRNHGEIPQKKRQSGACEFFTRFLKLVDFWE